jgi:hypothetical protein
MNRRSQLPFEDPAALRAALLRHARADGPSERTRRRVLEGVAAAGVSVGAGLLATATVEQGAAVSTGKVGSLVVAKWVLSGALAATAALGVREAVIDDRAERAPAVRTFASGERAPGQRRENRAPTAVIANPDEAATRLEPVEVPAAVAPKTPPISAALPTETPTRSAPPVTARSGEPKKGLSPLATTAKPRPEEAPAMLPRADSATAQLSQEVALLEKTRAQLAHQAPLAALDVLADYDRFFAPGALKIEATALRVEALAAAGQGREAERLGRAFLAAHPANPMAHRVRAILALLEKAPSRP